MASLEKSRKLLGQKGPTLVLFSCLIVTGTVMLSLFTPAIREKSSVRFARDSPRGNPGGRVYTFGAVAP
jgi:hypothetical protein